MPEDKKPNISMQEMIRRIETNTKEIVDEDAKMPVYFDGKEGIILVPEDGEVIDAYFADSEIEKGGAGSGNFGHAGRPGERGGSGPGGGVNTRAGVSSRTHTGTSAEFLAKDRDAYVGELKKERDAMFDSQHNMETSIFYGADWIGQDQSGRILALNLAFAKQFGNKITDRDLMDVFSRMRPGVNPQLGLVIAKMGMMSIKDGKPYDSTDDFMKTMLKEKEFSEKKFREQFGDSVKAYKGIPAKHFSVFKDAKDGLDVKDMPLSSYTIDRKVAEKFAGRDGWIIERDVKADEVLAGVHSHQSFSEPYGQFKHGEGELIVINKEPKTFFPVEKLSSMLMEH